MDEAATAKPRPAGTMGWGTAVLIVLALLLGGLIGNKTAHSSKAPPACLAAVNWAEDIAAGRADAEALRQFEEQAAKCRA